MNDPVITRELLSQALILRGLFKGLVDLSLEGRSGEIASAMVQAGLPIIEQLADDLSALNHTTESEG